LLACLWNSATFSFTPLFSFAVSVPWICELQMMRMGVHRIHDVWSSRCMRVLLIRNQRDVDIKRTLWMTWFRKSPAHPDWRALRRLLRFAWIFPRHSYRSSCPLYERSVQVADLLSLFILDAIASRGSYRLSWYPGLLPSAPPPESWSSLGTHSTSCRTPYRYS
jgi:hypothetical protein